MENEKINLILERLDDLEKKVQDNNNILHSERNSKR
jgi:tetrahydromethanopterin S-methyltransferase subunit G